MSQQQVTVTITARDGASTTFQAIGRAATGMSSSAQAAATSTAGSLQRVQQSAATTQTAVGRIGPAFDVVKGAAAGLVGSAVVGFLSDAARAAAESEAVMARLTTAVEATGASMAELAPRIDAASAAAMQLAFDDEAAAAALATLTQQTGSAEEALGLLGLTMDVARGRGVDLETAANAVGKAAAGSVTALQRMGVVIEEGATSSEALAAAQAAFAGQAEAYAGTTQGAFDKVATSLGNVTEAIGEQLGPAQTLIGLLPGMSTGFSLITSAATGLGGASGLAGIVASANPAVIAIGALAVGVGALTVAFVDAAEAVKTYNGAADELLRVTTALADPALAAGIQGWGIRLEEAVSLYPLAAVGGENFAEAVTAYNTSLADTVRVAADTEYSLAALSSLFGTVDQALKDNTGTVYDAAAAFADMQTVLAATGRSGDDAQATLSLLNSLLADGTIPLSEYATEVGRLANEFLPKWAGEERELTSSIVGTRQEFERYTDSFVRGALDRTVAGEAAARRAEEMVQADEERARAAEEAADRITAAAEETAAAQIARIEEARAAVEERAQRTADSQIEEAERAEDQVVAAAEALAEGQIAAAQDAEREIVAAAERAAAAQVRAAENAARDVNRAINQGQRDAERAAQEDYNKKSAAAKRGEEAAKTSAEREYAARVEAAERAADREIEAIRRKYEGNEEERLVREAEARKAAIIDGAREEREAAEAAATRQRVEAERAAEREMLAEKRAAQRQATQSAREEARKVAAAEKQAAADVAAAREAAEQRTADKIEAINAALETARQTAAAETEAVRTAAAQRVARVEERTAARIEEVTQGLARTQAAYADAVAIAWEEAAARKQAALTGESVTLPDREPLDGPPSGSGRQGPRGLRSGVTDVAITGTGATAKAVALDTREFDQTLREVEAQIYRFERDPVIATVAANLQKFEAAVGPLRGATIGTVFFEAALGLGTYNSTIASMNNNIVGNQIFTVTPKAVGKTYKLVETGTRSATPSGAAAGGVSTREAFAPAAVAAGAAAGMTPAAAPAGGGGTGEVRFYGPVTFTMANANVADEVRRQLQTRKRS